jgi:molybdate transport system substrate-binding protein
MKLRLLSGGAAQALVGALAPQYKAETGFDIDGVFGAVGAMRTRLRDGDPADLLILTRALIDELAAAGCIDPASVSDIGAVRTAVAARASDPPPAVGDATALRDALLAADAIYSPDQTLSTAGIHFAKVLEALGIAAEVAGRLREYPNGAAAMGALAASTDDRPIGCTQVTEILATPGLILAGVLPPEFELSTVYTLGVTPSAAHPEAASKLAVMLTAAEAKRLRERVGFDR